MCVYVGGGGVKHFFSVTLYICQKSGLSPALVRDPSFKCS